MGKKKHFLLIDTETTQTDKVADFGAIVCDKQGNIVNSCAVLIRDFYLDREQHPLFHFSSENDPLWGKANLPRRYSEYDAMLANGSRMLATIPAINRWLAKVAAQYNPVMTAYNLSFDYGKMNNSGIDTGLFPSKFCLWHASYNKWAFTKKYRQFILDNHLFNPPTKHGNMSIKTSAEPMAAFILNNPNMPPEPHTAIEDARDYELPILTKLVNNCKVKDYMNAPPFDWRKMQAKDHFKPI